MLINGALLLNSNSCNKGSTKQEPDDSFFHAKLSCFQGMKTVILEINTKHLKLPKSFSSNDLFGEESHPDKSSVKPKHFGKKLLFDAKSAKSEKLPISDTSVGSF